MRLLAGDIGGTNARLVLYEAPDSQAELANYKSITSHRVISQKYYKNNDFQSFTEVLCTFLSIPSHAELKIHSCCFAVAGPVADNRINFTNREGWIINGNSIKEEFDIDSVLLINDFVANGYGLLSLTKQELTTLQKGKPSAPDMFSAPVALVGAGTGLGECFLTPEKDGTVTAHATEGGHVEFAPRTDLEQQLLSFLETRLDPGCKYSETDVLPRVSVERLVSGTGLENIYEFLREKFPDQVNSELDHEYQHSTEKGRLIGSQKYNYSLFMNALEIMFSVYGGEVGNVALKYLPFAGIYVAGGIAPKNIEMITGRDSAFMKRFADKGRMSSLMPDFPLHVVMNEDLGIRGAHTVASQRAAQLLTDPPLVVETNEKQQQSNERSSNLSLSQAVRAAVTSYPLAYALVMSTTAALTAAACVAGLQILRKTKRI
ncbi:Glucokinase [Gracilariopsis chorda]|uniref:Glucokinase n=1 Tax=Gracilariopsis chorda TaxID=448386 RepID=A0A2V3IF71_9FLOR|nr:Glucokinase [Gracilariopsis chorda]|eukprot:PXF40717.1 Glucokinase [Gracilariopsis chorda]